RAVARQGGAVGREKSIDDRTSRHRASLYGSTDRRRTRDDHRDYQRARETEARASDHGLVPSVRLLIVPAPLHVEWCRAERSLSPSEEAPRLGEREVRIATAAISGRVGSKPQRGAPMSRVLDCLVALSLVPLSASAQVIGGVVTGSVQGVTQGARNGQPPRDT